MAHTLKVLLCLSVLAYGSLALDMDCTTMLPADTTYDSQPSPIKITVSATAFRVGQAITVNVSSANAFHHFLLQAQGATPVGTFVSPPAQALLKKCVSDGDSVTHSDDADKKEISFRWVAPDNLDSFKFVGSFHVAGANVAHKLESVEIRKLQEDDDDEDEEETPATGSDEEEGEEAERQKQIREEEEATEKLREEERMRQEADNVAPPGAPVDEDEEKKEETEEDKKDNDMDGEEEEGEEEEDSDKDEEGYVVPEETEDAIREAKEKQERLRMIEYERHQKEMMDEREDWLRRQEEETGEEEEAEEEEKEEEKKKPDWVDQEKDRVEEKEGEKTKITDGSGSSAACATISIATVLTAAVLSLF